MKNENLPWEAVRREDYALWRDHVRFCKEALLHCVIHLITTFFVVLLIGVAIALPAGLWIARDYLSHADLVWPAERGLNAFFKSEVQDSAIESTTEVIRNHSSVAAATLIPKDEALKEFLSATDLPHINEEELANPLPHTLTILLVEGATREDIDQLITFIGTLDDIEQVSYDSQIIERLSAIYSILNRMLWVIGVTFAVFAFFVSSSAVRIAIEERLHEIRMLHVMGSPTRVIRGPFLWCGFIYGLLGGFFANVLLALVLMYLEHPVDTLTSSYGIDNDLQNLEWLFVLSVTVLGALLGVLSAYYSTLRHIIRVTKNWVI